MTSKVCEQCGAAFDCGASAGTCWCMQIPLEPAKLKTLRETYQDCLCQACLKIAGNSQNSL